MNQPMYSTGQAARLLGLRQHQIAYAIANNQLPEPARFCGKRLFTQEDLRVIAAYFGVEFDRIPEAQKENYVQI